MDLSPLTSMKRTPDSPRLARTQAVSTSGSGSASPAGEAAAASTVGEAAAVSTVGDAAADSTVGDAGVGSGFKPDPACAGTAVDAVCGLPLFDEQAARARQRGCGCQCDDGPQRKGCSGHGGTPYFSRFTQALRTRRSRDDCCPEPLSYWAEGLPSIAGGGKRNSERVKDQTPPRPVRGAKML